MGDLNIPFTTCEGCPQASKCNSQEWCGQGEWDATLKSLQVVVVRGKKVCASTLAEKKKARGAQPKVAAKPAVPASSNAATIEPRIAAMVATADGVLLPYTAQSTMSQCEEWCQANLAAWEQQKKLGSRIVAVEIRPLG